MQLALVEIEGKLEQQTILEVPLVFGLQEGGRRLLSRVFHRPIKSEMIQTLTKRAEATKSPGIEC